MKTVNVCDFFSSPIGLGHVTRDIAIVNNLDDILLDILSRRSTAKVLLQKSLPKSTTSL